MVCLMCSIGALAQEAYAVFTEADSTLTFFYDELRTTVGLATCGSLHLLMELHI